MSDIFISYASEDVARASQLAQALSLRGWSVWWDRSILPGKIFDTVIETELSSAKCVLVLWTAQSVESRWVRAEAGEALDKGRLIPVLLDAVVIPLVFRQVQAASLIGWDGADAHAGFQHLLKAISGVVAPAAEQPAQVAAHTGTPDAAAPRTVASGVPAAAMPSPRMGRWALAALAVLVTAAGAFYVLRDDQPTGPPPSLDARQTEASPTLVAVAPALPAAPPAQAGAR
ncbi:MAG: toll/interleukin-1 receptor domain-containing protein, partial [Gammaproteobacteria bacterium]